MSTGGMMGNLTKNEIEQGYIIAAKIVKLLGDDYLPLFERLHQELEAKSKKDQLKELALCVGNI